MERSSTWKQEGSLIYRVYYLPVAMLHLATSVARSNLISLGTCFGKFSKTGKFKLGITSLDWLAKYAKYKVCPQADRPWPFRPSLFGLQRERRTADICRYGLNHLENYLSYMVTTF
jgi:hypothetical protein